MKNHCLRLLSFSIVFLICASIYAENVSYQTAQDQIKQGELRQALTTLKQAVDADPKNKQYAQEFMLLRQIIATQQQLEREKNLARWNAYAQRLRTYYEQKQADSLLLELDKAIYAKTPNADNASLFAESLIAASQSAEAVELLDRLSDKNRTAHSQIVKGLALLHKGKTEDAQKIRAVYGEPSAKELLPNPVLLRLARLEAGLGDKETAISTLKRLFEQTPASQQIPLRDLCQSAKEFEAFQSSEDFVSTLNTASKVAESDCSGGSSCGTCPMRSKCQGQ